MNSKSPDLVFFHIPSLPASFIIFFNFSVRACSIDDKDLLFRPPPAPLLFGFFTTNTAACSPHLVPPVCLACVYLFLCSPGINYHNHMPG